MTDAMRRAREMLAAEYEAAGYRDEALAFRAGDWTCHDHPALIALTKAITREPSEADVERVARAIAAELYGCSVSDLPLSAKGSEKAIHVARAAIAALALGAKPSPPE